MDTSFPAGGGIGGTVPANKLERPPPYRERIHRLEKFKTITNRAETPRQEKKIGLPVHFHRPAYHAGKIHILILSPSPFSLKKTLSTWIQKRGCAFLRIPNDITEYGRLYPHLPEELFTAFERHWTNCLKPTFFCM